MRVLVTGATGLIGSHTAARLAATDHEVRAFVREEGKLRRVLAPFPEAAAVEGATGDLDDPASLEKALVGCDVLVHCAGVFSHDPEDAVRLQRVNVEGTETALAAAERAGVRRTVFVSSALALFPPTGAVQRADDPVARPRTRYARTKALAERGVRARQAAGAPITSVYPTSVHGPHDPTVGGGPAMIADALRAGQVLVTDGGLAFADVRDLADLLVALVEAREPPPRVMAATEFVTHERYLRIARELTGRDLTARRIPGVALRALGRAGDLVGRLRGRPPQLTGEAADVLTRSVPVDDAPARALLGRDPLPMERSFRDLYRWLFEAGVLGAEHVGRVASAREFN